MIWIMSFGYVPTIVELDNIVRDRINKCLIEFRWSDPINIVRSAINVNTQSQSFFHVFPCFYYYFSIEPDKKKMQLMNSE